MIQPVDNRFDKRLYRVYSRLSNRLYNPDWQPAVSCKRGFRPTEPISHNAIAMWSWLKSVSYTWNEETLGQLWAFSNFWFELDANARQTDDRPTDDILQSIMEPSRRKVHNNCTRQCFARTLIHYKFHVGVYTYYKPLSFLQNTRRPLVLIDWTFAECWLMFWCSSICGSSSFTVSWTRRVKWDWLVISTFT